MPPMYWSTGSQYLAASRSTGTLARGEQNRAKYQELSTNVSIVSVSRLAGLPHDGQSTCFHVGWRSSGLPGTSKVTSSGRRTGSWSSGTGTIPQESQCTIGIGQPQ